MRPCLLNGLRGIVWSASSACGYIHANKPNEVGTNMQYWIGRHLHSAELVTVERDGHQNKQMELVKKIGISTVDSSLSGLGGCPYAKGASGNVATEDAVYMLNGLGLKTHVDLKKFMLAGDFICKHLGRSSGSKTTVALSKVTAPASKL